MWVIDCQNSDLITVAEVKVSDIITRDNRSEHGSYIREAYGKGDRRTFKADFGWATMDATRAVRRLRKGEAKRCQECMKDPSHFI